jgi:hypothetical protein
MLLWTLIGGSSSSSLPNPPVMDEPAREGEFEMTLGRVCRIGRGVKRAFFWKSHQRARAPNSVTPSKIPRTMGIGFGLGSVGADAETNGS